MTDKDHAKEDRRAAALRENLRKRKAQAREIGEHDGPPADGGD